MTNDVDSYVDVVKLVDRSVYRVGRFREKTIQIYVCGKMDGILRLIFTLTGVKNGPLGEIKRDRQRGP
jgi:hypothetical protein